MNLEIIEQGLKTTALTDERIKAFIEAGIPAQVVAETVGVSVSSIRNYSVKQAEPRLEAAHAIDDLRCAMGQIVLKGAAPEEAAKWMTSRSTEPPFQRPIELIREDPIKVLEMISTDFEEKLS